MTLGNEYNLSKEEQEKIWTEITRTEGMCFCTDACKPPPEGVDRCVVSPPTKEELLAELKHSVITLYVKYRNFQKAGITDLTLLDARRALLDSYNHIRSMPDAEQQPVDR